VSVDPRCPVDDVARVLPLARRAGAWGPHVRAALFHDLDRLEARVDAIHRAGPEGALHAIAIKANPLVELLRRVVARGAGLEAASWEEVTVALAAGCPADRIVFDGPAKTDQELRQALELGVWLNADSAEELARLEALGAPGRARVGLRVNPQLGAGAIAITSTVSRGATFGVPIDEAPALLDRYPFVTGLHVHTGSQGVGLELIAAAARATATLAEERGLSWVDVGGGLPVRYTATDPEPPTVEAWGEVLRDLPASPKVLTELGRAIHAGTGWALSRIEAVKELDGVPTLVVHLGADFLLRRVYRAEDWDHEMVVLDPDGRPRGGALRPTHIAGPLCFSGDRLARERPMPSARPGDLLLIRDTGAYTLAMWSRHCSRGLPATWGYRADGVEKLHAGETAEEVARFWSL